MADKGIVYIFTNPCLDGWVKIGMSEKDDIKDRLAELNNPANIPLSFRAYATYQVENPLVVEKGIQKLIDTIDCTLRAIEQKENGRIRKREFYRVSPEKAFEIFKVVAELRGDMDCLRLVEPTEIEQDIEKIICYKKSRLNLKDIGIPNGASLKFVNNEAITCIADCDKNKLIYDNVPYSISALAIKLLNEKCNWNIKSIAGGSYFKYNDETLNDIREQQDAD